MDLFDATAEALLLAPGKEILDAAKLSFY